MLRAFTRITPRALPRTSAFSRSNRAFSTTPLARSDDHHGPPAPQLYGPGAKSEDKIPTDEEQATGIERYQLLGKMEGVDVFELGPLEAGRLGTMKDPIKVPTMFPERLIGCTGSPADSHEVVWLSATTAKPRHRCTECGSVYTLDYQGEEHAHAH